jgi:hypothetical protein
MSAWTLYKIEFEIFFIIYSKELDCNMNFAIYIPPQASSGKVPVLYWLSGTYYFTGKSVV